jgi:hypothetical protein
MDYGPSNGKMQRKLHCSFHTKFIRPLERNYTFFERGKTSPSLDQLAKLYKRMPVLVYEKIKTSEHLHFIKRYRTELRFIGKMNVIGILLVGLAGYWHLYGTRYGKAVYDGLMTIMSAAKLDNEKYKVCEWFQKKDRLIIYVTNSD